MIDFEKVIGKKIHKFREFEGCKISRNQSELDLEEGFKEKFYVHPKDNSFEMILNKSKKIQTVFLYPDKQGNFPFRNLNTGYSRPMLIQTFGLSTFHRKPFNSVLLGRNYGFDRYDKDDLVVNFNYGNNKQTTLESITLMRPKTAPKIKGKFRSKRKNV